MANETTAQAPVKVAEPKEPKVPVLVGERGVRLQTLDEFARFAKAVYLSGLAPDALKSPEAIMVAMQCGLEFGFTLMQSLRSIVVVHGKPSVYGDALKAMVDQSGLMTDFDVQEIGAEGTDGWGFEVTSFRKGRPRPVVTRFTVADAKRAGLWSKGGVWTAHPKRMLRYRALAFNLRDNFPDVAMGLHTVEELQDEAPLDGGTFARVVEQPPQTTAERAASILHTEPKAPADAAVKPGGEAPPSAQAPPLAGESADRDPGADDELPDPQVEAIERELHRRGIRREELPEFETATEALQYVKALLEPDQVRTIEATLQGASLGEGRLALCAADQFMTLMQEANRLKGGKRRRA